MAILLVVDDEPSICWGLQRMGESLGHEVVTASSAEEALEICRQKTPDAMFLDVRLPGMSGLEAMRDFRTLAPELPVIVMTAYGDLETAVTAVRHGAFEYLLKPFDLERSRDVLLRALRGSIPEAVPDRPTQIGGMIGTSPHMQEAFKKIALAAATDINVLISGESGTGKELAARAIHRYSARADGPFVTVNIAALNPSLAESELFGHARGAFTGADYERVGLLAQAQGGTLFLDEVADIPLPVQVKLLRALEYGEIVPVGGNQARVANFRILCASHQNLQTKVQQGAFRHDLYFRLCAFEVHMPALRDCPEDIPEMAEYFLSGFRRDGRRWVISPEAMAEIARRPWLGNARELRNAMEHAATLSRGGTIEAEHIPRPSTLSADSLVSEHELERLLASTICRWTRTQLAERQPIQDLYQRFLQLVEPSLVATVFEHHRRQYAAAARTLGIHRTTLRKKLDELGLSDEGVTDK